MEPEENPYAVLLAIDYPTMKAREYSYLVELRDSPEWIDETGYLLNIHYTAALAEYMLEKDSKKNHDASSESLSQAIHQFPWLIAQLFYALKIPFPPAFPTTVPPSPLQALYTDLYIHRSKDLWIIPEISAWLASVTKRIAADVVEPPASQIVESVSLNVARHIFVMNVPVLMSHIPREYTSRTQLASDPLPPENSVSPYDASMRSLPGMARDEGALHRWIAGLVRGNQIPMERRLDDDESEDEDVDDDDADEEENRETFVTQLTNTFRNAFSWFATREEDDEEDEELYDDGHGVD
jgi:Transcriptional repressor TCF25